MIETALCVKYYFKIVLGKLCASLRGKTDEIRLIKNTSVKRLESFNIKDNNNTYFINTRHNYYQFFVLNYKGAYSEESFIM